MRAWCRERGMRLTAYKASKFDRETWLRSLRRDEAAVLPRLDIIVSPRGQREGRPSHEFTRILDQVRARAALVVDVFHDARSDEPKSWDNALSAALNRVASGRNPLPPREARKMQAASVASRNRKSVLTKWRGLKERNAPEYRNARAVWKSREFPNAAAAHDALPEELHAVSRVSLDRLFDGRD